MGKKTKDPCCKRESACCKGCPEMKGKKKKKGACENVSRGPCAGDWKKSTKKDKPCDKKKKEKPCEKKKDEKPCDKKKDDKKPCDKKKDDKKPCDKKKDDKPCKKFAKLGEEHGVDKAVKTGINKKLPSVIAAKSKILNIFSPICSWFKGVRGHIESKTPTDPVVNLKKKLPDPAVLQKQIKDAAAERSRLLIQAAQEKLDNLKKLDWKGMFQKRDFQPMLNTLMGSKMSDGPTRPMKFPYTFSAKIAQFPMKFYIQNQWIWRYYAVSFAACIPVFYSIHKLSNSPGNVAKWAEIRRKEALEHHH